MTPDELIDFQEIIKYLEATAASKLGATMFNWTCLMNDADKSEPPNPHVHWHFRPRYKTAPVINGQDYPDPNFGHHYDNKASLTLTTGKTESIINLLKPVDF